MWSWASPFSLIHFPNAGNPQMKFRVRELFTFIEEAEADEGHPVWTSPTQLELRAPTLDPDFPINDHLPKHLCSWKASAKKKTILSWDTTAVSVQAELPAESSQRNSEFLSLLCPPQSDWSREKKENHSRVDSAEAF